MVTTILCTNLSHFQIDWQQKAVYCPQGKRSYLWKNNKNTYGKPVIDVEFRQRDRVLSELKLGKQAPGYKNAQKALNRFITELTRSV
ncbi:hypothetical protein [Dendronalium sp. ChiSLP03b]|uniref:hypothetical protein n=1 Tax=Dendronalium sp. ChiSLP03b TaxID=3075381 RepID=UPI002AD26AD9|nr:hypothetical protein [Dendronalium sp. ChiSLP03b]MDZ8206400.1 hypothetical protein [Dendronalium sp. ChiSLP03b]